MYKHRGKVMIKILQGSVVTYTNRVRWANYIYSGCQISYSVYLSKIMKIGRQ